MRPLPPKVATKVMAAADLIAEFGLDGTKIEEIASVTGVRKATLYYHFEGKEGVLSYIFGVLLDALGAAVDTAVQTPGNGMERLRRVVEGHLDVFATYPKAARALHFDLGRAARLPEINEKTRVAYIDPVQALLIGGAKDGSIKVISNPHLAAVALLAATSTAAIHVTVIDGDGDLSGVSDVISELVLDGLQPT
jgi:TetR/AcrR family transcriptional regulator